MIKLKDIRHSRYLFAAAVIILVTVAAVFLSKTEKTQLTETGGRTFEKGIVT